MFRSALAALLLSGCYLAHSQNDAGTDGSSFCPSGTYMVPIRYEEVSPPGCFTTLPGTLPVRVPVVPEDFTGMCGAMPGAVVETAPCAWTINTECLIPDFSSTVRGTISARGGVVVGRLLVVQSSVAGECRFNVVLGE